MTDHTLTIDVFGYEDEFVLTVPTAPRGEWLSGHMGAIGTEMPGHHFFCGWGGENTVVIMAVGMQSGERQIVITETSADNPIVVHRFNSRDRDHGFQNFEARILHALTAIFADPLDGTITYKSNKTIWQNRKDAGRRVGEASVGGTNWISVGEAFSREIDVNMLIGPFGSLDQISRRVRDAVKAAENADNKIETAVACFSGPTPPPMTTPQRDQLERALGFALAAAGFLPQP